MAKLVDFQCPSCKLVEEHFEDEKPACPKCMFIPDLLGLGELKVAMNPIFFAQEKWAAVPAQRQIRRNL